MFFIIGKTWEGNQLTAIMKDKNLKKLEDLLPERLHCYVEGFRMLRELYGTISRSDMKSNNLRYVNLNKDQIKEEYLVECQEKIDAFIEVFDYLKFRFNQSKTPKIHTIESHVMDYIKLTGKPLGSLDQCIESVHQYFDQRMNSSKYKVKEKSSDVAGDKLLKLVLHFNAYNLFN